jgi:hypothetical protein
MWNIVTMEDNKNYLVDVTNCDENAIGADDKLFLVTGTGSVSGGYTITVSGQQIRYLYDQYTINAFGSSILTLSSTSYTVHNYVATTTKSATCGETGIITYTCSDGDASYTTTIPATGNHTTSAAKKENVIKATSSKSGSYDSVVYCSICGTELSRKPVTIYKISTITLSSSSYVYNGNAKKPTVTVKNSKGKKIDATYYSVSYKNNKTPGTATVTIKFKTLYSGTLSKTFTIKPKGTSISSTSRKSKGFTVKWKAQKTQTSGYQIQYSTSSKFTTSTTKSALIKISKTSYTVTSLKAKKTYYIRIRTYKTVGKKKYYSAWSTVKKVTTK